ncbi:MAG: hypothetical protein WBM08_13935 [Prochlorococcaceae cyanobacterium]
MNPAAWTWWGPCAATWGLSSLATGVAITVPQTTYTLSDGSVEGLDSQGAYGAPA